MALSGDAILWLQLALGVAGLALLIRGYALERRGEPARGQRIRDAFLVVLGILGAAAYFNFGQLHAGRFMHTWDTYHYYMGSKYFRELGYQRLYVCSVIAAAEDVGRPSVERLVITDLRTNDQIPAKQVLADPLECKQHFTSPRWAQFKRDFEFFRANEHNWRWPMYFTDHGYNATPVWNALGQALANTGTATHAQLTALLLLDPLFLLATAAIIAWAFGWRVAMVALLFLGIEMPGRYYWTGGSFLRHDWLFWLVGSVCLLKKDKPLVAGMFIAYATMLRVFPAVAIVGPLCAFVAFYRRERRFDPRLLRYFAGGIAATCVLGVGSMALSGAKSWDEFVANTAKHAATPLTNHMGLPTVVSFRPGNSFEEIHRTAKADPWATYKAARIEAFKEALPLFVIGAAIFLVLLYLAIAKSSAEPWLAAALGIGMISMVELTGYYYCFLVGLLLAMHRRTEVGVVMMLLAVAWLLIELSWSGPHHDDKFVAMTVVLLVAYAAILLRFAGLLHAWTPEVRAPA